ncbi:MAG: hypothetical protein ACLSAP_09260 [Oscillospiraceae bacterium]
MENSLRRSSTTVPRASHAWRVEGGQRSSLKLVGEGGLPAPRSVERSVEGSLARGEYRRSRWDTLGECVDMAGMRMLYECDLLKCAPQGLEGMHACVRSENPKIAAAANAVLARLGCDISCGTRFSIDRAGRHVTAFDEVNGYVWHERLLALGCMSEFEKGRSVALPYDAPRMLDRLAAQFGCAVCRYFECPADASDAKARELAKTQPFVRDALMLTIKLLDYLVRSGQTLQQAIGSTPEFAVTQKEYAYTGDVGALMRTLGSHAVQNEMGEGILLPDKDERGVVLVRPLSAALASGYMPGQTIRKLRRSSVRRLRIPFNKAGGGLQRKKGPADRKARRAFSI